MSLANELTASKKLAPAVLPYCQTQTVAVLTGAAQPAMPTTAVINNPTGVAQVGIFSYYLADPTNAGTGITQISWSSGGGAGTEILSIIPSGTLLNGSYTNGCVLTAVAPNSVAALQISYGAGFDLTGGTLYIYWTPLTPQA